MKILFPQAINSDIKGYIFLLNFYGETCELEFDEIILDFNETTFIEANLFAVIGAILTRLERELNTIKIVNLSNQIELLLKRNHFLSHFGGYSLADFYESTVEYRKFKPTDGKLFEKYLEKELLSKPSMPSVSRGLRKEINKSILEIFHNAVIHADSNNIFTCGQYFRNKSTLSFAIVDLGITIKRNINNFLNTSKPGKEAIAWAVEEGNTTKTGEIPGGLGLSLIREFLKLNKGKMQIISDDGYWEQAVENYIEGFTLEDEFPGTIVNFEFNVADTSQYYLESELSEDDIF